MTDSLNVIINPASSSLDVLDACRERIAAGDIDSIAIVAVRKNGGIWTGSSTPAKIFTLAGGMHWMIRQLLDRT